MEPIYGATGSQQTPTPEHPERWQAQRQAVRCASAQLASGFVIALLNFGTLAWELTSPSADPHGYMAIFSVVASVVLLIPFIAIATTALALLRRGRRSGAVWLIVCSALSILGVLFCLQNAAVGRIELGRILVVGAGIIWLAVSILCIIAASRALRRLPESR